MEELQVPESTPCNRHHAISLLFANDPDLLHFFFMPCRRQLGFKSARKMLYCADRYLGDQQVLLVRLGLAIWQDKGRISFLDAYRGLYSYHFEAFLRALELLYSTGGCVCPTCQQRQVAWTNDNRLNIDYF